MRLIVVAVLPGALALVLAGCATTGGEDGPSAARGQLLAEAQCGTCHAVTGEAQPGQAPSFSSLAARYRAHSLRARLTEIDETGHFNMPPLKMGDADVEDIAAWLDSLPLP
ncbi:MAG: c-type cytochrome [Phenylobacterium sp.]